MNPVISIRLVIADLCVATSSMYGEHNLLKLHVSQNNFDHTNAINCYTLVEAQLEASIESRPNLPHCALSRKPFPATIGLLTMSNELDSQLRY